MLLRCHFAVGISGAHGGLEKIVSNGRRLLPGVTVERNSRIGVFGPTGCARTNSVINYMCAVALIERPRCHRRAGTLSRGKGRIRAITTLQWVKAA